MNVMELAPNREPYVDIRAYLPIRDGRRDIGGETQCPVRERDGSRCENICSQHADQLRRGRKLILVNGTRLDVPWTPARRLGVYLTRSPSGPEETQ